MTWRSHHCQPGVVKRYSLSFQHSSCLNWQPLNYHVRRNSIYVFHVILTYSLFRAGIEREEAHKNSAMNSPVFSFLSFLVFASSLAFGFVVSPRIATTYGLSTGLQLYKSVEDAISEAQRICADDPSSPECQVAWDIVEELEATDSRRQAQVRAHDMDQAHSMDYVALMGSFDILTQKIDGKMDQLIATCDKFEALGADPSVAELSRLAEEMKRGVAYVKDTLRG